MHASDTGELATVSESVLVSTSPQTAYEAISDVSRMGEWSPECTGADVGVEGSATVGTRFRGTNRRGWARWATQCTVVAAEPGNRFAFEVRAAGGPVARWEYGFDEEADGTRITESWTDRRRGFHGSLISLVGLVFVRTTDRPAHNRKMMRATLQSVKRRLEGTTLAQE